MYLVYRSGYLLCLHYDVGSPTLSLTFPLWCTSFHLWWMDMHEWFMPLDDPFPVANPHPQVHPLELRVPLMHASQAPSKGTIACISPRQI